MIINYRILILLFIGIIKPSFGAKKSLKMQNMLQQADEENPHASKEAYQKQKLEKHFMEVSSPEGRVLLKKGKIVLKCDWVHTSKPKN